MSEQQKWWTNPQGIVSAVTILVMILGFFYVRERQLWEHGARIIALEARGDKAIERVDKRLEKMELQIATIKDAQQYLKEYVDKECSKSE